MYQKIIFKSIAFFLIQLFLVMETAWCANLSTLSPKIVLADIVVHKLFYQSNGDFARFSRNNILAAIERRSFDIPGWMNSEAKEQIADVMEGIVGDFKLLMEKKVLRLFDKRKLLATHSVIIRDPDRGWSDSNEKDVSMIIRNKENGGPGFDWGKLRTDGESGKGIWVVLNETDRDIVISFEGSVLEGDYRYREDIGVSFKG